jgi:hypothetical protein
VRRMLPAVAAAIVALIALVIAVVVFTRGGR